jgi:hypothetical protein
MKIRLEQFHLAGLGDGARIGRTIAGAGQDHHHIALNLPPSGSERRLEPRSRSLVLDCDLPVVEPGQLLLREVEKLIEGQRPGDPQLIDRPHRGERGSAEHQAGVDRPDGIGGAGQVGANEGEGARERVARHLGASPMRHAPSK